MGLKVIAIEGIDCSGKETEARKIVEDLQGKGYSVATESFPRYDKPIGALLKSWFKGEIELSAEAVHMLLEADRQDFMDEIKRLEAEGVDFLVLDRFTMSNLAFGVAKGIEFDWLRKLQSKIQQPDVTFILDITAETSLRRRSQGRDRHEQDTSLLTKAGKSYKAIARRLRQDDDMLVYVLDANHATPEQVHECVMSHIKLAMEVTDG